MLHILQRADALTDGDGELGSAASLVRRTADLAAEVATLARQLEDKQARLQKNQVRSCRQWQHKRAKIHRITDICSCQCQLATHDHGLLVPHRWCDHCLSTRQTIGRRSSSSNSSNSDSRRESGRSSNSSSRSNKGVRVTSSRLPPQLRQKTGSSEARPRSPEALDSLSAAQRSASPLLLPRRSPAALDHHPAVRSEHPPPCMSQPHI